MTKTQTVSTIAPYLFGTGQGAYYEQAQQVVEMLNYAFGHYPQVHISLVTADDDWAGGADDPPTHAITFDASSGWITYYNFTIWVSPDVDSLTVEATCKFTGTNNGQVRFTLGGGTATLTGFTAGAESTDSTTLNTSSTGTGFLDCTVELNHTTGSDTGQELVDLRVEDNPITSSLPDPPAE